MSDDATSEGRAKAIQDVAYWLVAVQSEEPSPQVRAEFVDWLRESPLHVSELLRACRLHRNLVAFSKWGEVAASDADTSRVVDLWPRRLNVGSQGAAPRWRSLARKHLILATASAIAAVAICVVVAITWLAPTTLQTQPGERREVTLNDGSVVNLAPQSEVRVRYRPRVRDITLDHGEALFHVAKNPKRPFIVQAGGARVRAVGTVFNVERSEQSVSVTVVEGKVTVSAVPSDGRSDAAGRTGSDVSLSADEQVVISSTGGTTPIRKVNGEVEIAWAAAELIFDNETVAEVVRRFNLHNRIQIQVVDPGLAARRISGVFRATDPESFVAFVESAGGVSVIRPNADQVLLRTPAIDPDTSARP